MRPVKAMIALHAVLIALTLAAAAYVASTCPAPCRLIDIFPHIKGFSK